MGALEASQPLANEYLLSAKGNTCHHCGYKPQELDAQGKLASLSELWEIVGLSLALCMLLGSLGPAWE